MSMVKVHNEVTFPEMYWSDKIKTLFPEELISLLSRLHKKFNPERLELLRRREVQQKKYNQGTLPEFLDKKSSAVTGEWKINPLPEELLKRRVEITGPVNSAKMVINMLNPQNGIRADMAMLDFEDSMKPTFPNILDGYENVKRAVNKTLDYSQGDKKYQLDPADTAYVMVRVRGLHLDEVNFRVLGENISAGLLDLVTCFFHTARSYKEQNLTPKYYIPKCESHLEARWWSSVFFELEKNLGFESPCLRATFLIETLPAAFEVEEILYEIKEHAAGLNVGRWDKIFSDIKTFQNDPKRILADRNTITMEKPWMENYAKRIIKICHDRGAFAMGGMAAFTPGKTEELREEQNAKVRKDKDREASWGHDGCWVSHPYFIKSALDAMNFKNQLDRKIDFDKYSDLLPTNEGPHTLQGLRINIRVGIAYMDGWNKGLGCVAFDNLMEDLATLEISRTQTIQWLRHNLKLDDGTIVTRELIDNVFNEELLKILEEEKNNNTLTTERGKELMQAMEDALTLFNKEKMDDFLTFKSDEA